MNNLPDSISPGVEPIGTRPELRAAFAEAKTAAGLGYVRAKAWAAWAEDDAASYDDVYPKVLHAVREIAITVSDTRVLAEVRAVAEVYSSSVP